MYARRFQEGYVRRIVDDHIDRHLGDLPSLMLYGPRGVGKTTTATRRATTVRRLSRAKQRGALAANPALICDDRPPVLIDDWHRVPRVWDTVLHNSTMPEPDGPFLLTGTPHTAILNTAAYPATGKVTTIHMRPLSLPERLTVAPTVSLARLLDGTAGSIAGTSPLGPADYAREIERSGFPAVRHLSGQALHDKLDRYLGEIATRDLVEVNHRLRKPDTFRRWLRAYASATSTLAPWEAIRRACLAPDGTPWAPTTHPWIENLTNLRLIEQLPGWQPAAGDTMGFVTGQRRHLADPGLALRALGGTAEGLIGGQHFTSDLIADADMFAALLNSLAAQSLRVFAQVGQTEVSHLRTRSALHTIDFVVTGGDRLAAIQLTAAPTAEGVDVAPLHWLRGRYPDRVADLVVLTTGPRASRRPDGIAEIPLALLGP